MYKGPFQDQVNEARKSLVKLRRAAPYLFHEWQELKQAEMDLARAKKRYEAAKKRWQHDLNIDKE
jgi:hypothetical protein